MKEIDFEQMHSSELVLLRFKQSKQVSYYFGKPRIQFFRPSGACTEMPINKQQKLLFAVTFASEDIVRVGKCPSLFLLLTLAFRQTKDIFLSCLLKARQDMRTSHHQDLV